MLCPTAVFCHQKDTSRVCWGGRVISTDPSPTTGTHIVPSTVFVLTDMLTTALTNLCVVASKYFQCYRCNEFSNKMQPFILQPNLLHVNVISWNIFISSRNSAILKNKDITLLILYLTSLHILLDWLYWIGSSPCILD